MSYCSVEDVKIVTHSKPGQFGYKKDPNEFEVLIQKWIKQSESLINSYCHRKWDYDKVPPAVENVCIRLTANMIGFYHARKDDPIKKVNEYSVKMFSSEIFTPDLRQDLKPFKRSKRISVFSI